MLANEPIQEGFPNGGNVAAADGAKRLFELGPELALKMFTTARSDGHLLAKVYHVVLIWTRPRFYDGP